MTETQVNTPTPRGGWKWVRRMFFIVLKVLVACLLIWWTLLYFQQEKIMFPAGMAPRVATPQPPANTEILSRAIDGGQVEAWLIPAPSATEQSPAPLVVFFHGNAETIDDQDFILAGYQRLGCNVLLVEYRGYGRSAGRPGQVAITDDAAHFIELALQRSYVDAACLVYHGRSLGGAVAAQAVTRHKPQALILESSFYSGAAMAHRFLTPGFLMRNPFDTASVVAAYDGPVLLFHGEQDQQIPPAQSQWLLQIAKDGRRVTYPASHNYFPGHENLEAYWREIADFLRGKGVLKSPAP